VEGRYKPSQPWALRLSALRAREYVNSESYASRRFDIRSTQLDPEVTYAPTRVLQVSAGMSWSVKRDRLGDLRARLLKLPLQARFNRVQRLQVTGRFEVASIDLDESAGESPVGLAQFELTDGRGPGTSYLWALIGQYTINRYLRATFQYDGRTPSEGPTLHTLRMQLSAVF
jgi:hypothetical protein